MAEETEKKAEETEEKPRNWGAVIVGLVIVAVTTVIVLGYVLNWEWSGVQDKTLMDWVELLIIPGVLAGGFPIVNEMLKRAEKHRAAEREKAEKRLAAERVRAAALQAYLDDMGKLIMDGNLGKPPDDPDDEKEKEALGRINALASAKTLTILSMLADDKERRQLICDFLVAADLLRGFTLRKARLGKVQLWLANLQEADLWRANLREANLWRADLEKAYLRFANLKEADLEDVNLENARLFWADLQGAKLWGANLKGANLFNANLQGAQLYGAKFNEETWLPAAWENWSPDTDMARFTDPEHPNFWRSDDPRSPAYRGDDDADDGEYIRENT